MPGADKKLAIHNQFHNLNHRSPTFNSRCTSYFTDTARKNHGAPKCSTSGSCSLMALSARMRAALCSDRTRQHSVAGS